MNLCKIKESSQKVAEAISSVLDLDVTIINSNMYRVAATGKYKNKIGNKLPNNCYFETIAKKRVVKFITKPNFNSKCTYCEYKENCKEIGSLGYPIIDNNNLIGIIGVLAFNEEQKNKIIQKYDSLITFLDRLSKLLLTNLKYEKTIDHLILQDKFTNKILNEIDSGVILIDSSGFIKLINNKSLSLLKLNENFTLDKNIKIIIPELNLNILDTYTEYKLNINNIIVGFMIKIIPIYLNESIENYIIKINKTSSMIKNAYDLMQESQKIDFPDIIGNSIQLNSAKELAYNISKSDSTVILRGESGTGKDLFARAIHENSHRKNSPFIVINCASIPDTLLESEFFGYEKGSFTGAKKDGHIGKFELANGGTLFLDEIGDMPLRLQPKILRVIQDKQFMKIGGKEIINTDFRLITATNKNLEKMIKENTFREDLYYRLNVIPIYLPKLIERDGDLNLLIDFFMEKQCNNLNIKTKTFTKDAMKSLNNYHWPGNIRELENLMEFLANTIQKNIIDKTDLPKKIFSSTIIKKDSLTLKDMMEEYEKNILLNYLETYGSSTVDKKNISKKLNIDLSTLYRKLEKYNI